MSMSKTAFWSIIVYVSDHVCNLKIMHGDHWQSSSLVIGELFRSKFTIVGHQLRPKGLIEDVHREHEENMSYCKAWKTRKCAYSSACGTSKESYAKLLLWFAILELTNPRLFTRIETNSENNFSITLWPLFFRFKEPYRGHNDLVFIAYRHASFVPVIWSVYLNAYQGWYTNHLRWNMKVR